MAAAAASAAITVVLDCGMGKRLEFKRRNRFDASGLKVDDGKRAAWPNKMVAMIDDNAPHCGPKNNRASRHVLPCNWYLEVHTRP